MWLTLRGNVLFFDDDIRPVERNGFVSPDAYVVYPFFAARVPGVRSHVFLRSILFDEPLQQQPFGAGFRLPANQGFQHLIPRFGKPASGSQGQRHDFAAFWPESMH